MKALPLLLAIVGLLVGWQAPVQASNFVKFGEVAGGSTAPRRAGWSDLKSYKGGTRRTPAGKIEAKETKIRICADKSSATLALKHATGEVIREVTIEFERPNPDSGESQVYHRIILCNVTITDIDTELQKGDNEKVEETYCVKFEKIKIENPIDGTRAEIEITPADNTVGTN